MQAMSELCEEVVAEHGQAGTGPDAAREGPAAAAYLQRLLGHHAQVLAQEQAMRDSPAARLSRRLDRVPRIARPLRSILRALVR